MSLKAFHIFFIVLSTLLSLGFSAWLFQQYTNAGSIPALMGAIASMIVGIALVIYGIQFLKKLKHVSFI